MGPLQGPNTKIGEAWLKLVSDYTHWSSAHCGVQIEFIEHLKELLTAEVKVPQQQVCTLSMDEMKIKSGLVFSRRSGDLVRFVDLGSVNKDLERLAADDKNPAEEQLADQMLVFMARAVFKPSLAVPVAYTPKP